MSTIWWCIVSGNGYKDCPDSFRKAVTRGTKVTGAAWRKGSGQTFVIAIESVLTAQIDEKRAKNDLQKKFLPGNIFGKTLPLCTKFKFENFYEGRQNFFGYFNQQGFQVIRPHMGAAPADAIVALPSSISTDDS